MNRHQPRMRGIVVAIAGVMQVVFVLGLAVEAVQAQGKVAPTKPDTASVDAQWIDLLKDVNPAMDRKHGTWRSTGDGLASDDTAKARIRLAAAPEGEYELMVQFTRTADHWVGVILSHKGRQFAWIMDDFRHRSGFHLVNDHQYPNNKSTIRKRPLITTGAKQTLSVTVRDHSITVRLNGAKVTTFETDYSDLDLGALSVGAGRLGLLTNGPVTFHAVKVRPLGTAPKAAKGEKADKVDETTERPAKKEKPGRRKQQEREDANAIVTLPLGTTGTGTRMEGNSGRPFNATMKVIEREGDTVVIKVHDFQYDVELTFQLNGNSLTLVNSAQSRGRWGRDLSNVQAGGNVNGNVVNLQYRWMLNARKRKNNQVYGTMTFKLNR